MRRKMGDDAFVALMARYFAANTTKTVTADSFLQLAGMPYQVPDVGTGPAYLVRDLRTRQTPAVIVYGTASEAGVNRYAAEQLQLQLRDQLQRELPIYKDFEVNDAMLSHLDVMFIGRPETNSMLASWSEKLGLEYHGPVFKVADVTYASERNGLVFAAKNPLDATRMVVVFAGNSPLETARSIRGSGQAPAVVLENGASKTPDDPAL